MKPLLEVSKLTIGFAGRSQPAVDGVSFTLTAGETVAIVGESGSGKSTTGLALLGLLAPAAQVRSGSVRFKGREILGQSSRDWARMRGREFGFVPQDPMTNLNPVRKVGGQVGEALLVHGVIPRNRVAARVLELLAEAGLTDPERVAGSYPHQLSGGMKQRALIAMALACRPALLLADEPTSALDVTVQRIILDRLLAQSAETGASTLLITHDLALAAERADRIIVMKAGEIVEQGPAIDVFENPREEYTKRLLASAPTLESVPMVHNAGGRPEPLLVATALRKTFHVAGRRQPKVAADDVSFEIAHGRTLGIVGESGSGKTTVSRIILGLETATAGSVTYAGQETTTLRGAALRAYRRAVQPVFQDPYSSLDGSYTIGSIIGEPMMLAKVPKAERRSRILTLLDQVALPRDVIDRKPNALSGGQRQRVAIARALAADPRIVVCDEAVSALDVVVQHQILELLVSLQQKLGVSFLFISHDLAVIRMIAHDVVVMQNGRVVESGPTERVFTDPQAEYTRALLAAIPGPHHNEAIA